MSTATSPARAEVYVSSPVKFETLEGRLFLHGTVAELLELGVPKDMINDDGHIARADFATLTPAQQGHIDPHLIEEGIPEGGMDYDQLLGIPLSVSAPEAGANDTFPDWYPAIDGSITLDQTSQTGRVLVKFPTSIKNQGTGPGIGISNLPGSPIPTGAPITSWVRPDGSHVVLQPIYSFQNNQFTLSHYRDAGSFTYHPGHGHFHFDGYNNYRLRQNVGGQPGAYVERGDGTGIVGEKIGFCLINVSSSFIMENGQSSTTLPGYNATGQPGTGCGFVQGVHVGKADVYGSGTSGQWLDVTGVPNGNYFLEITVDGENVMQETNEANNTKTFPFTLNVNPPAGGITRDEYDQLGKNNDTPETAVDMQVMGTFVKTGLTVHWGNDRDWFRFVASSSGTYTVTSTQANGNVDIYLYDANVTQIGASSNASGAESISYNFVEGRTYYLKAQTYNGSTSSNYQVAWNLKPLATSTSPAPIAMEGGAIGRFRIARNGPLEQPLALSFTLGGTAQNGVDYQTVQTSVTMGNLDGFIDIEIVPIDDNLVEGRETITLTLGTSTAYVVGTTGSVVVIADNDLPRTRLNNTSLDALPRNPFGDRRVAEDLKDDVITTLLA